MTEKKVDESWKDSVLKEKTGTEPVKAEERPAKLQQQSRPREEAPQPASEADFIQFVSSLGMQALAALGALPDPATGRPRNTITTEDLAQAKYLIDIVQMLADKTKGNLTPEEAAALEEMTYQLRVRFVEKSGL